MTREERKLYIKSFYAPLFYGNLEHLVDEVYGDFEAQLKAKEDEIEILKTEKLRLEEECYKYHFKINKMLKDNQCY